PYAQWERAGTLTVTEGDVTDYAFVRAKIAEDCQTDGITQVFYDPKTARDTSQLLMAQGLDMLPNSQGTALREASKRLLALVTSGQLCHGGEDILSWMADNTVLMKGTKGEMRIDKQRAPEKIDGIAALVNAIEGGLVRRERTPEPDYDVFFVGGRA